MAIKKRTVIEYIDDISDEIVEKAETIAFSVRGTNYEIDLGEANAKKFDDALAPFIAKARKAGRKQSSKPSKSSSAPRAGADAKKVREWAKANGLEVSPMGRIEASVLAAYEAAQSGSAAPATAAKSSKTPESPEPSSGA